MEFDVNFRNHPLDLFAGHYFLVPQVGLSARAPARSHFLWLSAPKPIVPPGTPFPTGATDLQSWMRDDPPLAPDWLRIGTDIIKRGTPPTFTTYNASFEHSGHTVTPYGYDHAPVSAATGILDVPPAVAQRQLAR